MQSAKKKSHKNHNLKCEAKKNTKTHRYTDLHRRTTKKKKQQKPSESDQKKREMISV